MRKYITLGILFFIILACKEEKLMHTNSSSFYIGSYTNADSKGIYKALLDSKGKFSKLTLVAKTENPSFMAFTKDRKFLVTVNESDPGTISSFRVEKDSLVFVDKIDAHGAIPCHVTITDDNFVISSNYIGGNVVLSKIDEQGNLTFLDSKKHTGKTEHPRQEKPHVHSTWIHPKTGDIIAVDLGTNELWFYQIDMDTKKLIPKKQQKLAMDSLAGPRHLAFHPINPNWMYVLNELNASVSLVIYEDNVYKLKSTVSILTKDYKEYNASADIHISKDGQFLYASNRGHNSIAILKIDSKTGALHLIDIQKIPGSWPRNFSLTPDEKYLIYANKWTNNIFSMKRDSEKGILTLTDSIKVPNPVMILF